MIVYYIQYLQSCLLLEKFLYPALIFCQYILAIVFVWKNGYLFPSKSLRQFTSVSPAIFNTTNDLPFTTHKV